MAARGKIKYFWLFGLCAIMVGATSSEGFLVDSAFYAALLYVVSKLNNTLPLSGCRVAYFEAHCFASGLKLRVQNHGP